VLSTRYRRRLHRHRHRLARHAYILTSDTHDFLARMSARMSVSVSWNTAFMGTRWQSNNEQAVTNFLTLEFKENHRKIPLFYEVPEFNYNLAYDRLREACTPKTRWIRLAVLPQYRRVTDTQSSEYQRRSCTREHYASRLRFTR